MDLSESRIVLTGATGGLGSALAEGLASRGASMLLCGRNRRRLQELASGLGSAAQLAVVDLDSPSGVDELLAGAKDFGANMLVNNAGVMDFNLYAGQNWELIQRQISTNLIAPMKLTRALLPMFLSQPSASVVNIGSIYGAIPFAGFVAYSTVKAGLRGFSQALRRELADTNVRVFHFAPRAIDTAFNSDRVRELNLRMHSNVDTAEDVARKIIRHLQKDRYEVHFGAMERFFSGLNGLNSRLVDQGVARKLPIIKQLAKGEI